MGRMGGRWTADKKRRKNFVLGSPDRKALEYQKPLKERIRRIEKAKVG